MATQTSPVLRNLRDQAAQVLHHCDSQGAWEADIPSAPMAVYSYRLPKTQLLVFGCNVADPATFFDRAELEFAHFLRSTGAHSIQFERKATQGAHDLTWTYATAGREGVVTLWAATEDDRLRRVAITIHESRTPQ